MISESIRFLAHPRETSPTLVMAGNLRGTSPIVKEQPTQKCASREIRSQSPVFQNGTKFELSPRNEGVLRISCHICYGKYAPTEGLGAQVASDAESEIRVAPGGLAGFGVEVTQIVVALG